jgi:hypothetical protein
VYRLKADPAGAEAALAAWGLWPSACCASEMWGRTGAARLPNGRRRRVKLTEAVGSWPPAGDCAVRRLPPERASLVAACFRAAFQKNAFKLRQHRLQSRF